MNKVATCDHAGREYDINVKGKRLRVCGGCARIMGFDDVAKRWVWLGTIDEYLTELRKRQAQSEIKAA